ncbi:hypothetical protein CHLRE_03g168775v5 [Chlamydomonas reinhardtii]|uniref:Uncharacterized protein n=1 Tax=Chlamydomonas reinhardtii TaxID=3055 RepID=A0A2K3DWX3_CHLRE|nr:uncharacterized protein CHLRE_03g168775v5 [Chlamydomonas reinhardtii]PNW85032.1 hypothetical protein CHLRE_03g168775v5 [Chlamydomonas reinhardtii]
MGLTISPRASSRSPTSLVSHWRAPPRKAAPESSGWPSPLTPQHKRLELGVAAHALFQ